MFNIWKALAVTGFGWGLYATAQSNIKKFERIELEDALYSATWKSNILSGIVEDREKVANSIEKYETECNEYHAKHGLVLFKENTPRIEQENRDKEMARFATNSHVNSIPNMRRYETFEEIDFKRQMSKTKGKW